MNNSDLVSIIIPVYNCEKYIAEAIKSVKEQEYQKWELIIVNDKSTDNSINIIKEEIKEIKQDVILIDSPKNYGTAISRNIALNNAKGRYIAYLDADDIWEKQKLREQINFMKTNNIAFSYTDYTRINEKGTTLKKVVVPKVITYNTLLKNAMILTSTIIINTELINKEMLVMPELKTSEDTETWLNILKTGIIAKGLNKNLTKYRKRRNSASSNKLLVAKELWNVYRKYQSISRIKSTYYIILHMLNAAKKRIV